MPNKRYNGHTPTKLVKMKTAEMASRIIATVPLITLPKYKAIIATAIKMRITRSAVPMFLFINFGFDL